ncbi:MAG: class I SAM-dependent methyltransferase [Candidatus Hermodarchaeota archaeon]
MISERELKGINNSLRAFSLNLKLRSYQKTLVQFGIDLTNTTILDAGCGRGFSTALILGLFRPKKVYAFDFLPQQIELAKEMKIPAEFFVGSITDIKLDATLCEFAFVFNVLHHVPNWPKGIQEIRRILKPNGYVIFEEPTKQYTTFTDRLARVKHPEEGKFTQEEFFQHLDANGFTLVKDMSTMFGLYLALLCRKE